MTLVLGHETELCQECARRYFHWRAPDQLYLEIHGSLQGILCPDCFDKKARKAGIWVDWVPMVAARQSSLQPGWEWEMTTNWWNSPTRDRLMMGEPDPDFSTRGFDIEQPPWATLIGPGRAGEAPSPGHFLAVSYREAQKAENMVRSLREYQTSDNRRRLVKPLEAIEERLRRVRGAIDQARFHDFGGKL